MIERTRGAIRGVLAGTALAVVSAGSASATLLTLQDGNTVMNIESQRQNVGDLAGVIDWIVNGVDHMYEEAFWYRTNFDTQEIALASENITFEQTTDTNANPGDDVAVIEYTRAGVFRAEVKYSLQGGTCCSDLAEQVTIFNLSGNTLRFSLFEYTDFDLNDSSTDQRAWFADGAKFYQRDKLVLTETIVGPDPDHWEMDYYSATRDKLDDANVDVLSDVTTPLLNGDLTWAAQWDWVIPDGGSRTISKDKLITPVVPLPAPILMLVSAFGGLAFVRRRRG